MVLQRVTFYFAPAGSVRGWSAEDGGCFATKPPSFAEKPGGRRPQSILILINVEKDFTVNIT